VEGRDECWATPAFNRRNEPAEAGATTELEVLLVKKKRSSVGQDKRCTNARTPVLQRWCILQQMLNRATFLVAVFAGLVNTAAAQPPTVSMMARTYRLGSYNQKSHPTWEFITGRETVDNWTTLVTLIDRPDAHSREELDRLGEGVMSNYKSHGGQILSAKTMRDKSGAAYNYLVAAFEEPAKRR